MLLAERDIECPDRYVPANGFLASWATDGGLTGDESTSTQRTRDGRLAIHLFAKPDSQWRSTNQ